MTTGFVSTNFAKAEIEASESKDDSKEVKRTNSAERRNITTKGKTGSVKAKPFVAAGFFILGAVTGYLGYDSDKDAKFYHNEYKNSTNHAEIDGLKTKISDAESKRNLFYGISGASLVGITLTLVLF